MDEQIDLLKRKLRLIYQGEIFNGKPTKTARSHGKKFQVSVKQETSRLLVWLYYSIFGLGYLGLSLGRIGSGVFMLGPESASGLMVF